MQISVLKPNDENVKRLQGVIDYVYRTYDMNAVECYIVKDDGEIGFVFYGTNTNGEEMNLYINDKKDGLEFTAFTLDADGEFSYIGNEKYRLFYRGNSIDVLDSNGMQYSLSIVPLQSSSSAAVDFNSYFSFWQYNPKMDMACEIQYAQTLNRDMKDTNIFIKNPENIFIDSNWSMKGSIKPGFVPSSKAYFSKITVQEYDVSDMSSEISVRYIPIKYITKGGDYLTFGYFSKKYELDEMKEKIENLGFMSSVPSEFVDIYKETSFDIRRLKWIISEVEEERNKEENEKGMVFQLVLEENKN